jgi:polyhydroxyalkanoate synthesis regulator phasin
VQERVVTAAADPNFVFARLEAAVDSLRTSLAVVGLLAVVALGVSIYALTKTDDSSGTGSRSGLATDARVSSVEDRVDRLSRQLQTLRSSRSAGVGKSSTDTAALENRVGELESTVKTLADRPATDATQAVQELSGRIDDVAKDVEALKQAQQTTP